MKTLLPFVLLLLFTTDSTAQETPILKVGKTQVGLSSLDITVEIVGNKATTTFDMLYYNPTAEVLEGELSFPLGMNSNVSRFALDINGKLREAVVVDKELGRIAFEAVVRGRVDPALLEKGTGNNYKARIYPIPANGYKRVILAYEQELIYKKDGYYYDLPLHFKNKLDKFNLVITVFEQDASPVIEKGQVSGLEFENWKRNFRTNVNKVNYTPNKSILVKIPTAIDAKKLFISDDYFYSHIILNPKKRVRKKATEITLFWDASLSMKDRNLQKEMDLLASYFTHVENVKVHFKSFSNVLLTEKTFTVRDGNWNDLKNELQQTVYDGGTNYNILNSKLKGSDVVLLFSDGIQSLNTITYDSKTPLIVINSLTKSNHESLNTMVQTSKGTYINLNTKTALEAFAAIKYEQYRFLGFSSNKKTIEVYPNTSMPVESTFSIAGKNSSKDDSIILNFGYGTTTEETIILNFKDGQPDIASVPRMWAQKKLAYLQQNSTQHKTEIVNLATTHGLVTDYTSLIVLEEVMDYVRYKIEPPAELLEEYNKILADIERNEKKVLNGEPIRVEAIEDENEVIEESFMQISDTVSFNFTTSGNGFSQGYVNATEGVEVLSNGLSMQRLLPQEITAIEVVEESEVNLQSQQITTTPNYKKYKGKLKVVDQAVNTLYLKELLVNKTKEEAYDFYLTQRLKYKETPAYYVDISNAFRNYYNATDYSNRILSNIAETDFDNYELLKVYGYQLQATDQHRLALFVFKRVLELRTEDVQSYRDLAIAHENVGECQEAFDLFESILSGKIYKNKNRRNFAGLNSIIQHEVNYLMEKYNGDLDTSALDKTKAKSDPETFDVRIVVDWNHNDTDIDLHVIDPNLEECSYKHTKTKIGGKISKDMTQGFGPEEFTLQNAIKGDYFVKINYYGDSYQKVGNPTFMKVTLYKYYGTKKQTKEIKIIRLAKSKDQQIIAKLSF